MKDKVILTDCDGVLLDWEFSFDRWMNRHGYQCDNEGHFYKMGHKYNISGSEAKKLIRMFNESASIRKLPPLRDAIHYVKKLHYEHGYIFHAITSLSNDEYAQHLRTKNLRELFGDTVFDRYTYLDCGANKDNALKEYYNTNCFWVEDKPENVEVGMIYGLQGILMAHGHNADYEGKALRVQNWKEIYERIVG